MQEYLTFERMITPIIIQIIFWVALVAVVIGGFVALVSGEVISGLATIILGPVVVRVYCELVILFFRMNASLTDIKNNTERR